MAGELTLKWGTIKGWSGLNADQVEILKRFAALGMSGSAMMQEMTPAHKGVLCELIDSVDVIHNDWAGGTMTKEEAKNYVLEYGK